MNIKNIYGEVLLTIEGANLSGANLSGADLSDADLSDANLRRANLSGADLSDANLSGADLSDADLSDANLSDANLSGADLSDADLPNIIAIDGLFSSINDQLQAGGSLEMENWHTCETTHCIAGWVTTLAGDAGRVAENLLGTNAAAALIINQSCPYLEGKVPDFYTNNKDGLDFIKSCAEKEKQLLATQ